MLTPVQAQEYTIGPLCIKHQLLSWYDLLQAPSERREKISSNPASWELSKKVSCIFRAHPNFSYDFMIFHVLHNMRPAEEDELGPVWHQGGRRSREVLHLQQILLMTSELKWRCVVNQLEGSLGSL